MGNTVDFNQLRKKRQRVHRLKQLLILSGIGLLVVAGIYLNDLLVEQDISTRLSDAVASFGGGGYPVDLPGGVIRDVGNIGGNLAVLNDTNLYIYNKKGKLAGNIQQMTERSVMDIGGKRVLTYDIGGNSFKIHSPAKELLSQSVEDAILCADLAENGSYAIVTAPKQFVSQVSAYDANYNWKFTWYSSEYIVSGVSISPKGDMMAVSCIDADGGILESVLYIFKFSMKEALAEIRLPGELVVDLRMQNDNRTLVVTDQGALVYDAGGKMLGKSAFPATPLNMFEHSGKELLVVCGERDKGTQQVVWINEYGKQTAKIKTDQKINDIAVNSNFAYLLTRDSITRYNHMLEHSWTGSPGDTRKLAAAGGRIYCLSQEEILILEEH